MTSSAVLSQGDPPPVRVEKFGAGAEFLVVCDHAGRRVPKRLGSLGLPEDAFERHIAWDIGAEPVALGLGERLGATVVLQAYSRLVVDCNRAPDAADLIVARSDGTEVPGNAGLDASEAAARLAEVHAPYHAEIARLIDGAARPPLIVSIHSFTPRMNGHDRPWGFGVIHFPGSAASEAALEGLRARAGLPVGDNEPYAMDGIDYTVPFHAIRRGLDYVELEIRQDLIAGAEGQAWAAALLSDVLAACPTR